MVVNTLFATIVKFNNELSHPNTNAQHRLVRVSGWGFERWMLKAYCGMNAAGHIGKPSAIPDYMIEALFHGHPLPMDLGLYMAGQVGDLLQIGKTLQLRPARRPDTGEPCA